MRSNLSIIGIMAFNSSVFDDLILPEGMDKDVQIDTIMLKCAELELLYPDADFLKLAIKSWSDKNQNNWTKLYKTTVLEYNPIWNKDGTVTEVETEAGDRSRNDVDTAKGISHREQDSSGEATGKTAAFNSEDFVNKDYQEQSGEASEDVEANNSSVSIGKESDKRQRQYIRKEQGNIGVTSTQQLISEERDISRFNMYDFIALDFKNHFCLQIY